MSKGYFTKTCWHGRCKWLVQGESCVHCSHPNAVNYVELTKPCEMCGRLPGIEEKGCGNCIGRGHYVYPIAYEDCDCGGYEKAKSTTKEQEQELVDIAIAEKLMSYP